MNRVGARAGGEGRRGDGRSAVLRSLIRLTANPAR